MQGGCQDFEVAFWQGKGDGRLFFRVYQETLMLRHADINCLTNTVSKKDRYRTKSCTGLYYMGDLCIGPGMLMLAFKALLQPLGIVKLCKGFFTGGGCELKISK